MATEPRQCEHKDGCSELALYAFQWDWGEGGVCCAKHQTAYQQLQASLSRTCQFSLISNVDPPMERTERVKLKAEALVLAEELEETKLAALQQTRELELLKQQCASLTMRDSHQKASLIENEQQIAELKEKLEMSELENAELNDEARRLRAFVPTAAKKEDGTDPGRNVVG